MIIPESVIILGRKFRIELVNGMINDDVYGKCDLVRGVISLAKSQSEYSLGSTFLHEIIEAINSMLELKLEHPQISALETGLYATLREL